MHLTHGMIQDLKSVSEMSTRKGWEYAGTLDIVNRKGQWIYRGIKYNTSKHRMHVEREHWDSPVIFHTHPGISGNYVTLPSNADFNNSEINKINIICDNLGFYVIKVYNDKLPENVMEGVRRDPFLRVRQVSDNGMEYFAINDLREWKTFINRELNPYLLSLHGIDLKYREYFA